MNGFIKGTLLVAALAGVGTGGYFGYKKITDQDKKIKNLEIENTQLKEDVENKTAEISELNSRLKTKSDELAEKNKALESAMSELAESEKYKIKLQNDLNEKTTQLESANGEISTLSTQKISLLNAVTEIDNKINETEDAVEIETLEARKSAVLNQIDDLNTQIDKLKTDKQSLQTEVDNLKVEKSNLEKEITQLQTQKANLEKEITQLQTQISDLRTAISQLENTTGFTYKCTLQEIIIDNFSSPLIVSDTIYSFEDILNLNGTTIVGGTTYSNFRLCSGSTIKEIFDKFSEIPGSTFISKQSTLCYEFTFNGTLKCYSDSPGFVSDGTELTGISVYYNNELCENFQFEETSGYYVFATLENGFVKVYVLDATLSGKYVSENGKYIDFDKKLYSLDESHTGDFKTSQLYIDSTGVHISIWPDEFSSQLFIDYSNGTLTYSGQTFTKSES